MAPKKKHIVFFFSQDSEFVSAPMRNLLGINLGIILGTIWELFGKYLGTIWEFMAFRVVAQAAYCSRPRGVSPEDACDILAFSMSDVGRKRGAVRAANLRRD